MESSDFETINVCIRNSADRRGITEDDDPSARSFMRRHRTLMHLPSSCRTRVQQHAIERKPASRLSGSRAARRRTPLGTIRKRTGSRRAAGRIAPTRAPRGGLAVAWISPYISQEVVQFT
jgi:hypothetical protein